MQPLQERIIKKFDNYYIVADVITRRLIQDNLEISFITAKKLIKKLYLEKRIIGKRPTLESTEIEYVVIA